MTPTPSKRALQWHQAHRRENFAASQRLEGIHTPLTRAGNTAPLPTRAELIEKYTGKRKR